jgi:hypothetical protein
MIVTKLKDIENILEHLKDSRNIAIIGCDSCAAACQTGGKEDVEKMAGHLHENHTIVLKTVVDEACHHMLTKKQLREFVQIIEKSDAVLAMTCGAGVQSLAELFPDKKVIPASDTHVLGNVIRTGHFKSYCSMCGTCILADTEGICIKTRCPKSHVNGPCGGMFDGKCEVNTERECVFAIIYKKKKNRLSPEKSGFLKKDFSKVIDELQLPRKK